MKIKSIRNACRRLGLGDPEKYESKVRIAIAISWLPLSPLITSRYIEAIAGLETPLVIALIAIPLTLLIQGFNPVIKFRSHLNGIERESPFAILAVNVAVNAGLTVLRAFEELAKLEVLKAISFEVKRILRDCSLYRRHLSEQLAFEAREAKGLWAKLIKTIVSLERVGGDPRLALRDLMRETLRDMKVHYEVLSNRFRSMISSTNVLFGAMPMMLSVLFTLMASESVVPMVLSFTLINIVMAFTYMLIVDGQVPRTVDYTRIYMKIVAKWAPLCLAIGATFYLGFIQLPITLIAPKAVAISIAALTFTVPAWIEFKIHANTIDEILENLPTILRDLADEVEQGFSPHQALERLFENATYGKFTDKFIALLVKRARVFGSLRDSLIGIEKLLPVQARLALWLIVLGEELGATSSVYHELADAMHEYYLSLKSFKRSCQGFRWMAIGLAALTIALVITLFSTLISRISIISELAFKAEGIISLPFNIAGPEQLPLIKDWIYASVSLNSIVLALTAGKTLDWRLGGAFRDVALVSAIILTALAFGLVFRIL